MASDPDCARARALFEGRDGDLCRRLAAHPPWVRWVPAHTPPGDGGRLAAEPTCLRGRLRPRPDSRAERHEASVGASARCTRPLCWRRGLGGGLCWRSGSAPAARWRRHPRTGGSVSGWGGEPAVSAARSICAHRPRAEAARKRRGLSSAAGRGGPSAAWRHSLVVTLRGPHQGRRSRRGCLPCGRAGGVAVARRPAGKEGPGPGFGGMAVRVASRLPSCEATGALAGRNGGSGRVLYLRLGSGSALGPGAAGGGRVGGAGVGGWGLGRAGAQPGQSTPTLTLDLGRVARALQHTHVYACLWWTGDAKDQPARSRVIRVQSGS